MFYRLNNRDFRTVYLVALKPMSMQDNLPTYKIGGKITLKHY